MRSIIVAVIYQLGASGVAAAQSITPQQQEAIQDLANVVAANEECGFTADEGVSGAFLDRHGLRLETMAGELAFADRLNAALTSVRAAVLKDKTAFCERAWQMFGRDGSKIPGALRREI